MLGLKSFFNAAVTIHGIGLAEKIKKERFKPWKLGGRKSDDSRVVGSRPIITAHRSAPRTENDCSGQRSPRFAPEPQGARVSTPPPLDSIQELMSLAEDHNGQPAAGVRQRASRRQAGDRDSSLQRMRGSATWPTVD